MGKNGPVNIETAEAEQLVARFRGPLLSFFRRRVREPQDAEDLTHEVFLRLLRRDEAVPVDNPEIYVFRIAANLLRDRARRAASHRAAEHTSLEDLVEATTEARTIEAALQEDREPERVLLSQEALMEVVRALDELGPVTRDIFLLVRLEKMKHRDIAAAYGMAVSTVEKHVARGSVHLVRKFGVR
ncbi:MAG TPA: sigma-70 family RNA polymerase sigma factor [Caulobacteraceae bacterium]|nr:sigma-70 family RNA polymerase sigma factor [Caulobacteraceae bacterium]